MKRGTLSLIIGILFVLVLLLLILFLIKNIGITGEITSTQLTLLNTTTSIQGGDSGIEKTILDENQFLEARRHYTQTFVVSEPSRIFLSLDSDTPINYVLLSESQADRYKLDKSFTSYSFRTKILFLEDHYDLEPGSYSIIISTFSKPANFHLIVKEREESIE